MAGDKHKEPQNPVLRARGPTIDMQPNEGTNSTKMVDLRPFKERMRGALPAGSPLLSDLLLEPDSMPVDRAEVLVPHYLRRLERELEKYEAQGPLVLRL